MESAMDGRAMMPNIKGSTERRPRHASWQFGSCGEAAIAELIR